MAVDAPEKSVKHPSCKDWPEPHNLPAGLSHAPAAATAAVVTLNADADKVNILGQIFYSYTATPTGGEIKVEDEAGTVIFGPLDITAAGPGSFTFQPPIAGRKNKAMIITLASGAGAVVGTLTVNAWKEKG
jgi:hypothetical protein